MPGDSGLTFQDPPFIAAGRQAQLGRLIASFRESLAGKPQVSLITGDAGVGKTALVRAFCRQVQHLNESVVVAWGRCSSEHGDPYLPFIEIVGLLTGDVDGKAARSVLDEINARRLKNVAVTTAEIMVEVGGDLVGLLVPGAALLSRVVSLAAKALKIGWVSKLKKQVEKPSSREGFKPEQFFEQFSRVLARLAAERPLVLVLDDLHWADHASLELFFYLARRLQQTSGLCIMVLGTYRPAEIHLARDGERHPLEGIVHELRRYQSEVQIDLEKTLSGEAGRSFVDALLDSEPNRLDAAFRSFLLHRTDGHPLFTIEILRMLKQRGTLIQDHGRWVLARPITLDELPDSVEAVIEERIDRLEEQLRQILACGSVEGEQFTAEVIHRVRRIEEMQLANQLHDELERKYFLVVPNAEIHFAERYLHMYRFIHVVFQQYLYGTLSGLQREQLHRAVGEALEILCGSDLRPVAGQLARHFEIAHEDEKAIQYWLMAGEQASAAYANADAVRYLIRARDLSRGAAERRQQEYRIASALAHLYARQGRPPEQRAEISRMLELAQALGEKGKVAESYTHQSDYFTQTGDYAWAKQSAAEALRIATEISNQEGVAGAELAMGEACAFLAEHREALAHLRAAAQIWERLGNLGELANAVRLTALVHLNRNDYPEALAEAARALAMFRETGNRIGEDETLRYIGDVYCGQGDYQQGLDHYEKVLRLRRETGNRAREGGALGDIGDVHLLLGNYQLSLDLHRQSLAVNEEVGYKYGQAWAHHDIGVIQLNLGNLANARGELEQALRLASELPAPNLIVLSKNDLSRLLRLPGGQDNLRAALQLAREATEIADGAGLRFGQIVGRSYQAMAHSMLGDKARALEESRAAIALLESHGNTEALPEEIYYNHYSIMLAQGAPEEALSWLSKAHDVIAAKGSKITNPAFRESFFTNVPLNREILAAWQAKENTP
jgi:predicted ATPase